MRSVKGRPRRSGVAPTVGLVVEGDAEFAALPLLHRQRLVKGCPPLRAVNLGGVGSDRKPEGIAKLVVSKVLEHKAAGRTKVVVCIDREQRTVGPTELASQIWDALCSELSKRGGTSSDVYVLVADRAFEAWLLADAKGLHQRRVFKSAPRFSSFEGQLGERHLKGVVELEKLLGRPYSKTKDGPAVFAKLDFATARSPVKGGSTSLDDFLKTLGV